MIYPQDVVNVFIEWDKEELYVKFLLRVKSDIPNIKGFACTYAVNRHKTLHCGYKILGFLYHFHCEYEKALQEMAKEHGFTITTH